MERELGRMLVVAGGLVVLAGLALLLGGRLGLGRLPGDLSFGRGNVRFLLPLGTSIVLSVVLTLVLRLLR